MFVVGDLVGEVGDEESSRVEGPGFGPGTEIAEDKDGVIGRGEDFAVEFHPPLGVRREVGDAVEDAVGVLELGDEFRLTREDLFWSGLMFNARRLARCCGDSEEK